MSTNEGSADTGDGSGVRKSKRNRRKKRGRGGWKSLTASERAHQRQAAGEWIQAWLRAKYEVNVDVSIPREDIYQHYSEDVTAAGGEPVNAATFGKNLKTVYAHVTKRRLGGRGHSKYHYTGIQRRAEPPPPAPAVADGTPSTETSASHLAAAQQYSAQEAVSAAAAAAAAAALFAASNPAAAAAMYLPAAKAAVVANTNEPAATPPPNIYEAYPLTYNTGKYGPTDDGNVLSLPPVPSAQALELPPNISVESVQTFLAMYSNHLEELMRLANALDFEAITRSMQAFWQSVPPSYCDTLLNVDSIVEVMCVGDNFLYLILVRLFVPDILAHVPEDQIARLVAFNAAFVASVRRMMGFAAFPPKLVAAKVELAFAFSSTLQRRLKLNSIAYTARQVIESKTTIQAAAAHMEDGALDEVIAQGCWTTHCNPAVVRTVIRRVVELMSSGAPIEDWAAYMRDVFAQVVTPGAKPDETEARCRAFVLRFSYLSRLVLDDLALRNVPSFSEVHLVNVFLDQYLFALIEETLLAASHHSLQAVHLQRASLLSASDDPNGGAGVIGEAARVVQDTAAMGLGTYALAPLSPGASSGSAAVAAQAPLSAIPAGSFAPATNGSNRKRRVSQREGNGDDNDLTEVAAAMLAFEERSNAGSTNSADGPDPKRRKVPQ